MFSEKKSEENFASATFCLSSVLRVFVSFIVKNYLLFKIFLRKKESERLLIAGTYIMYNIIIIYIIFDTYYLYR